MLWGKGYPAVFVDDEHQRFFIARYDIRKHTLAQTNGCSRASEPLRIGMNVQRHVRIVNFAPLARLGADDLTQILGIGSLMHCVRMKEELTAKKEPTVA